MKALIVAAGNVGRAVLHVLITKGWAHQFFTERNDLDAFKKAIQNVDVVFITISTKDKGEAELAYLMCCVEMKIPVVTCAKGACAWYFKTLKPYLHHHIGITAVVGGGSEILPLAMYDPSDPIKRLCAIENGTINLLCWGMQGGLESEEATLAEALRRELPEPGATGLKSMFDSENRDMWMKGAVTWNVTGLGDIITPDDFSFPLFEEDLIRNLISKPGNRLVFEIKEMPENYRYSFSFEPFSLYRKPWLILGSFVPDAERVFPGLDISQESNAIMVARASGIYPKSGRGAGSKITAKTMFNDGCKLLGIV